MKARTAKRRRRAQPRRPAWPLKPRLVEVLWDDSTSIGGWMPVQSYVEHARRNGSCRTVGYLVERTRRGILMVQSMSEGGHVADSIAIPHGCIRNVRRLL